MTISHVLKILTEKTCKWLKILRDNIPFLVLTIIMIPVFVCSDVIDVGGEQNAKVSCMKLYYIILII